MTKLYVLLLIAFFAHSVASISRMLTYTPRFPFSFTQQIFWDSKINVALFADAGATVANASIYQLDWETKLLYETHLKKSSSAPSFCIPAASSSELLLCGFNNCVSYVSLPYLSHEAVRGKNVACRCESDLGQLDRGATLPDGTLIASLIPGNYCDTSLPHPEAAAARMDFESHSFVDSVFPGFYSNGFSYDSTTTTLFMADDCLPGVVAYKYHARNKSFSISRIVHRFVPAKNFPSGFALDQCGNLYVGEHNTGKVYYIDTKTGKLLKTIKVPGTHVTAVAIVGPNLDHLAVTTGNSYHDTYGNNRYTSSDPGDGKLYLIPLASDSCKGKAGTPVAGV